MDASDKAGFRPVSILSLVSQVFEKIVYDQLCEYMENFLSQLLYQFRKWHSTQHTLFRLFKDITKRSWLSGFIGTILMDLSKAYDWLPHDLLIPKLEAYDLVNDSLKLLLDYFCFRKQRTKVGSAYSKWSRQRRAIPQESILGPLLFNIFIMKYSELLNNQIFVILKMIIAYTHAGKVNRNLGKSDFWYKKYFKLV